MKVFLVCVGKNGNLLKVIETREAPPETLVVSSEVLSKCYERQHANECTAVYGHVPVGIAKTETAK